MHTLELKNVSSGYGGKAVLHDIALTANEPSVYVVLGPNGAGKTTPLGMVIGYLATVPAYFALAFPLAAGLLFDLAIVAIIALVSIAMLLSSDRLIRRETFLP